MVTLRTRNAFFLLAMAGALFGPACSTKAVGVEECRRIEYARCEAAPNCPGEFKVTDVELCQLFYRDHCLHGLAVATAPNATAVNACIEQIQELSNCASAEGGPDTALSSECGEFESTKPKLTTVCKLLAQPEAIPACGFLTADAAASGGQGGAGTGGTTTGGATNGAGGTGSGGAATDSQGGSGGLVGIGGLTL